MARGPAAARQLHACQHMGSMALSTLVVGACLVSTMMDACLRRRSNGDGGHVGRCDSVSW